MSDIEKRLEEQRKRTETISAPEEMEARIRKALENAEPARKKPVWKPWLLSAAVLLLLVGISSQYSALAFYGKKLLGFDEIMDAPIAELNEKGMGQPVGKTVALQDGSTLTIDGILSDDNQLLLFYTVENQDGIDWENGDSFSPTYISGFRTKSHRESGTYTTTENGTLQKGQFSFEPVNPFAKKLTLYYFEGNGGGVASSITFPYEANRAMRAGVKQRIGKTVKVDGGKIRFESITATPTMTLVKGKASVDNLDRVPDPFGAIDLVADGEPLASTGGGITSTIGGVKFEISYGPLPDGAKNLKLDMKALVGYQELDANVAVDERGIVPIGGKSLMITKFNQNGDDLDMTIRTEEDVMLDKVILEIKAGEVPLETTKRMDYVEDESGRVWKERVISFKTKEEPLYLLVGGMHYMKDYNQTVEIPVRKNR